MSQATILSPATDALKQGETEHEAAAIELRVDDPKQLFDSLDPYPFQERDIDRKVEEYIVGWARELSADREWQIVVHLPADRVNEVLEKELAVAFQRYFKYRADSAGLELRETFRIGRLSFAVGLFVLVGSIVASQSVGEVLKASAFTRTLQESLLILGWVANWRPLEIFLYDWVPIVRRRRLYRRLHSTKLVVRPA